jgi:hypothetical protein
MKEALSYPETLVLIRATRRNVPEGSILHSHRRENLKSYKRNRDSIEADRFRQIPVYFMRSSIKRFLFTRGNFASVFALCSLKEEHRLRAFENRMLRRLFGPKRDRRDGRVEKTA